MESETVEGGCSDPDILKSQVSPPEAASELASFLSTELKKQLDALREQIHQDLCAELRELRTDVSRAPPQSDPSPSNRKSIIRNLQEPPALMPGSQEDEAEYSHSGSPSGRRSVAFGNLVTRASTDTAGTTATQLQQGQLGRFERDSFASEPRWSEDNWRTPRESSASAVNLRQSQAAVEANQEIECAVSGIMTTGFIRSTRVRASRKGQMLLRLVEKIPLFHPGGYVTKFWCPSIYIAVLLVVTFTPFEVAFFWWNPPLAYKVGTVFLDIVFLVDMARYFNTAYYHRGKLVTNRKSIATRYFRSYFILDCIANFPFDWFLGSASATSRKFTKLGKLPKVLRFFRMLGAFKDHVEYVGVTAAIGALILLAHYVTCIWAISLAGSCDLNQSCPDVGESYWQGFRISLSGFITTESFASHFVPTDNGYTGLLAVASLRDMGEALKTHEDIIAIFTNLFGIVAMSYVFANVASAVRLRSELSVMRKRLLDRRKEELALANAPDRLCKKVIRCYQYIWGDPGGHLTDIPDGLLRDPQLSLWVKRELAHHVYGEALRKVGIFSGIADRFLKCLAQKVESNHYIPGDFIVLFGEVGKELFIIAEGVARPLNESEEWLGDITFMPGDVFGELCFLNPGTRRSASVVCLRFTRALVVTLETFQALSLNAALRSVRTTAHEILRKSRAEAEAGSKGRHSEGPKAAWQTDEDGRANVSTIEDSTSIVPAPALC